MLQAEKSGTQTWTLQHLTGIKEELNNLASEWSKCAIVRANDDAS